MMNTAVFCI